MRGRVVLEDELLRQWHAFKHTQTHDTQLIERLLQFYKPPHITCVAQLKRLQIQDEVLMASLAASQLVNQTLEELASLTDFKLVLSEQTTTYPYVCIHGDSIGSSYTLTCQPNTGRDKAHALLRALMSKAKTILIHDRFLEQQWTGAKQFFDLLPKRRLTLLFGYPLPQRKVTELKRHCTDWLVKDDRRGHYRQHHDRYLLIDQAMEVVVTSGLDYLFDQSKECTLIVREQASFIASASVQTQKQGTL
ncbi:MAG: hypothetical protein KFB96_06920 [Thiocapsa sp.]|uniref:hypothetical protein n=1 Tax=Thiocapsa sp. TaxID=2024551 RepID=UPI001BD19F56|nr:hypothetical protein [Thiocapsa sp.]QVL50184.1 MAG: hypothetical protein KFB96_06920 [Thiocapsa sp.]